jgi:hypothetical protein
VLARNNEKMGCLRDEPALVSVFLTWMPLLQKPLIRRGRGRPILI